MKKTQKSKGKKVSERVEKVGKIVSGIAIAIGALATVFAMVEKK